MAGKSDRGMENREIVLDILAEVLDKGSFVHLVLNQALRKYQYLDKSDRAFITRVTEGTLEYLLQIDYIINKYSKTKTDKMKPLIRNLLRMSVYQILYMDRVPDSAACNEAVKLAVRRRFTGLKGFGKRLPWCLIPLPWPTAFPSGCTICGKMNMAAERRR